MVYLYFAAMTFIVTWYDYKRLRDSSGADGYWHWPFMIMLIGFWFMPLIITPTFHYIAKACIWGFMFPFLFNTGLNIYRKQPLKHLGRYDFLSWNETLILFILGIIGIILDLAIWSG